MKKKTYWGLFIGSNFMIVLSAVAAIIYQNRFEATAVGFSISVILFILSVLFLFEIRSVCFGGNRPHLGTTRFFLRKYYEEENPEMYIAILKRNLSILWVVGLGFFGEGVIVSFIKLNL